MNDEGRYDPPTPIRYAAVQLVRRINLAGAELSQEVFDEAIDAAEQFAQAILVEARKGADQAYAFSQHEHR